ncbi:hypothetical protein Pmani_011094 [Petrolisthes manimaculis]|uniref:Uncharacterized protein n=1 Tax=Petrolisthes manimaculis TaxID=1843537 RepID=A0AAE1UG13_9EUCA|nr:hypothetical protein Pmani_011094 [Petrolisthes manimaculis]
MRTLVILAVVGACAAVPVIMDAPDVAAEKARFFEVFSAIEAAALPKPGQAIAPAKWYGPLAATVPAGLPGSSPVVANTAEVNAARDEFFNSYRAQLASVDGAPQVEVVQAWTGPMAATVPAGLPGSSPFVANTADVNAARQAFFDSYSRQVKETSGVRV